MGGAVFPPCCLTWTKLWWGNENKGPPSKGLVVFSAPDPATGHCQPTPLPENSGHSQASLGQSPLGSLLPSPGSWCAQGFVCVLQECVSQSCVSSGGNMVGLMETSSKRAYAMPRKSAAPKAPAPAAVHCWPIPMQETLKHGSCWISVGSLGPGVHKVCLRPPRVSGGYTVWF